MRPLLAFLLSLAIFGAVGGYLRFLHRVQAELVPTEATSAPAQAAGTFSLDVTLTFDAGGENAFALEPTQATALVVRFGERDMLRVEESIAAGAPLRVEEIEGIVPGPNEFYVEAQPADQGQPVAHAVRVRVFRDGNPVGDQTLWSEPGLPVRGTVRIHVREELAHEHQ